MKTQVLLAFLLMELISKVMQSSYPHPFEKFTSTPHLDFFFSFPSLAFSTTTNALCCGIFPSTSTTSLPRDTRSQGRFFFTLFTKGSNSFTPFLFHFIYCFP